MLSVVIPMYNEEKNILRTVNTLIPYMNGFNCDYEIIFSDDGSRDSGAGIVSALSEKYSCIRLIVSPENRGKGSALKIGMKKAVGDFIIYTDCDLAYGTDCIGKIYDKLKLGDSKLVVGSRALHPQGYENYPALRRLISERFAHMLRKKNPSFIYSDPQCGIKGFSAGAVNAIIPQCITDGYALDYEMLLLADKNGLRVSEFPVRIINHSNKSSHVKPISDSFKMLSEISAIKKAHIG